VSAVSISVLDLVSTAPFQEALNWLNRLLMSDVETSREPVVTGMIRLSGDGAKDALRTRLLAVTYLLDISRSP
jgi:hypothetical protein